MFYKQRNTENRTFYEFLWQLHRSNYHFFQEKIVRISYCLILGKEIENSHENMLG